MQWQQRLCFVKLGHIYDRISSDNITLCAPRNNNSSLLFSHQSKSNVLEIGFEATAKGDSHEFYVIKLQGWTSQSLILLVLTSTSKNGIVINGFKYMRLKNLLATGCSDLIPPADAWLKRTENEATIGCYSTRLRWQLKCVGQRWIGVIGNCSYGEAAI